MGSRKPTDADLDLGVSDNARAIRPRLAKQPHVDVGTADPNTLLPADYNPRTIGPEERRALTESIKRFGLVQPIVVNRRNNVIVGGHQRCKVAVDVGMRTVPVVWVDLDDIKERALNVALNARELQGKFTQDLDGLIEELFDVDPDLLASLNLDGLLPEEKDDPEIREWQDDDVSVQGMWTFQAPASDASRVREVLRRELGNALVWHERVIVDG